MIQILRNIHLPNRFFYLFVGVILVFIISFPFAILFPVALTVLVLALAIVLVDILLLFNRSTRIKCRRRLPRVFSLGDENTVRIEIQNQSRQQLYLEVIDELPFQFQRRDFSVSLNLEPQEKQALTYTVRPLERGAYTFGKINIFIASNLGLVQRRYQHNFPMEVAVYPFHHSDEKF